MCGILLGLGEELGMLRKNVNVLLVYPLPHIHSNHSASASSASFGINVFTQSIVHVKLAVVDGCFRYFAYILFVKLSMCSFSFSMLFPAHCTPPEACST